ncbi:PAN domain containing protein [Aphelenchoides avenae]|nr:PAN domain containing protein [Aphelenchus avenae]
MHTTALNSLILCFCLLVHYGAAQASGSYAAYAGVGSSASSTTPAPPLAPPRVPIPESANVVGPSLGYRPPPPPVRRDAESSGKCSFDSSKWAIEPQSAIAGAIMFDRTTGLSCEECLKKCTEFQDPSSKWVCRSLTYDNRWKICDLFAVDGNSHPYFLTEYDGRDYFAYQAALPPTDAQLNGEKTKDESDSDLLSKSNTEEKAVRRVGISKSGSKACQSDEVAHYADFSLFERTAESDEAETVQGKTREDCVNACELEESTSCASASFEPSGCKLSISRANHSDARALSPSTSASYLEKLCLPVKLAKGLKKVLDAVPGHILVGHVQEVADATSVKDCVAACLRAEHDFGFECKSVMWYPTDATQNCLLNTESRHTQPDVFVNEDQGVLMVYLDVPRNSAVKDNALTMRFKDSPMLNPVLSKWTRWSMCTSSGDVTAMRHRYLKCSSRKDIRKCPKESVMCGHLPTLQIKKLKNRKELFGPTSRTEQTPIGTCYAVKDSRGRKRCPHGLRINAEGRREYCRDPVDC